MLSVIFWQDYTAIRYMGIFWGVLMIFEGNIQQLKFYLKHLKRDRGITARRIEEIGPEQYRIDIKGADTMKEIQKNSMERIKIQRTEYKGKDLIDLRVFYQDKRTGEWKPSPKGITFSSGLLEEVIQGLDELKK